MFQISVQEDGTLKASVKEKDKAYFSDFNQEKFLKLAVSNVEGEIDFVEVIPSGDDDEWHSMLSGSLDTIDLAERKNTIFCQESSNRFS